MQNTPWERNLDILVHASLGCQPCCSSGLSFFTRIQDGTVQNGNFFTKFRAGIVSLIFWYIKWLYHGTDPSCSVCSQDMSFVSNYNWFSVSISSVGHIWLLCSQPASHLQFWNVALLTYFVLPFRWNSKYREACPNLLKFLASSLQWDETTPCHRLLKIHYNILFFILRILHMLNDFHDDHNIFSAATIFHTFNVHRL